MKTIKKAAGRVLLGLAAAFALPFIVTIVIGVLGTSRLTAQQAAPTETRSLSEETVASLDFGRLSLVGAAGNRREIGREQLLDEYMSKSALRHDREKVEALARSITFPQVINQGELLMNVEFPNAAVLCLNAAYYAGQVQGLIWAMDRHTVEEQELYWTIDDADALFQGCFNILLQEAFPGQARSGKVQLKEVKEKVVEQVQRIQGKLRKARNVKIKRAELLVGGHF